MKLVQSPFIKAFLDSANKKFLLEVPHSRVSLAKDSKLEPLRDLDDRIISFSPFNKNVKYTQPSEYEDCFERMSFEQPQPEVDFWRDSELYQVGHESKRYKLEPYSSDDVSLADNISNRMHSQYNYRLSNAFYPDTDITYDDKVALKLIDFTEDIVPSSFPRQMDVNFDTIRSYAKTAVNAWEMGVPTNEIPKLITKSILKGAEGKGGRVEHLSKCSRACAADGRCAVNRREYLKTITEQIRCEKAREGIAKELNGHIEDQKETFLKEGMTETEAEEAAVREMGDPVAAGVELDRIHRPKMPWGLIALIGILHAAGFFLRHLLDARIEGVVFVSSGGSGILGEIVFLLAGLALMIGVCYLDYSRIGRYAKGIWWF